MQPVDFYDILGVTKDATTKEIKKAYRELSKIHHPDKPTGSEERFKEISKAYEVLSDSQKRERYDLGEPIEIESREEKASRNIYRLFDSIISSGSFSPADSDLMAAFRSDVNGKVLQMESDIEDEEIRRRTLDEILLYLKGEQAEGLRRYIENTILTINSSIAGIEESIKVSNLMLEIFNSGEFNYERPISDTGGDAGGLEAAEGSPEVDGPSEREPFNEDFWG